MVDDKDRAGFVSARPPLLPRWRFALRLAVRHALLSVLVAVVSALFVFGVLSPPPFQSLLGVGAIFVLLLGVDVVCGPLLTLILASPSKSVRERWVDLGLVGLVQVAALLYGLHAVWAARPVVLAFETDRLVVVTANQVQTEALAQAPVGLQTLPWWGVVPVSTRHPVDTEELFTSVNLSLSGISPAMRPGWWQPWDSAQMDTRAKPITELLAPPARRVHLARRHCGHRFGGTATALPAPDHRQNQRLGGAAQCQWARGGSCTCGRLFAATLTTRRIGKLIAASRSLLTTYSHCTWKEWPP